MENSEQGTESFFKHCEQHLEEITDDLNSDTNTESEDTDFDFPIRYAPQKEKNQETQKHQLQTKSAISESDKVIVCILNIPEYCLM